MKEGKLNLPYTENGKHGKCTYGKRQNRKCTSWKKTEINTLENGKKTYTEIAITEFAIH